MCKAISCVCGGEAHRVDLDSGLYLFACTAAGCNHFAEPAFKEAGALHIWNAANSVDRVCLNCEKLPFLRFSSKRKMWSMKCPGCGWSTAGAHSAQGAITAWIRANKPNDSHIKLLWTARYAELCAV